MSVSFSVEQPFGIKLYPYFEKGYEAVVGQPASAFAFKPGVTPLASFNEGNANSALSLDFSPFYFNLVAISCIIYFIVIFGGQFALRRLPSFKLQVLKIPFQVHNVLLTVVSATLLALTVEQILPKYQAHGLFYTICEASAWDQKLELLYYMNYLVKYWELLDTGFLVLKKKKLGKNEDPT